MLAPSGRPWQRLCAAACTLWACGALNPRVGSATENAPALLDPMGAEQPVLRLLNPGPRVALLSQESVRGETPHGGGAELLVVQAPAGESAQLSYRIPPAPVLPELRLAMSFNCDRPGARLAAVVELPRVTDPATGRPLRLMVRGEQIAGSHEWQHLQLDRLPVAVRRHARTVMHADLGSLDVRGAMVTELVLLAPGGREPATLTVDQIAVYGVLGHSAAPADDDKSVAPAAYLQTADLPAQATTAAATGPALTPFRPAVQRVVQWQGEPLAELARLGFTGVLVEGAPTADLFDQAARANLSIVCPPPPGGRLDPSVVERLAQIAAWDLGGLIGPQDASVALREQQRLRGLDPDRGRPSLLRPGAYVREASRVADCLLVEPAVTRPGQTPGHVARELGEVVQAARPGSAFWVTLSTQLDASQAAQLAMLRGGAPSREPLSYRALLRSAAVASSCRPRGLAFRSAERLDQRDAATRQRALTLQLLNRRLGLLEPWLASGRMAAAARSSRPELAGLVLQAERAYLIVPIAWDQPLLGGAFETGQPTALILPGAAESAEAYLLTDVGTERLRTQRVTGGLRITLDALPENAFVLVTEDGQAFAQVRRYLQRGAAETAAAWCELTELRLADAQRSWALLPSSVAQDPLAMEPLARAEALLREAQNARNLGQLERACAAIAEADARLERHCVALSQRVAGASRPGEFPAIADWTTLGDLALTAAASQRDDGAWLPLGAGEFESLEQVLAAGWRRRQQNIPGCVTGVHLASAGAAAGQYCLELSARGEGEGPPPHWHGASVWVASPVIPAPAGYLIEIRGLARNAAPELGGAPPLWIFDSLGGEALGVAAGESAAWEPFHLRRVGAGQEGCQLIIALRQLGAAQVDQVEYRVVPLAPPPAQLAGPTTPPAAETTSGGRAQRLEGPRAVAP